MTLPLGAPIPRLPSGRVAPLAHLAWCSASVASVVEETADARSLVLDVHAVAGPRGRAARRRAAHGARRLPGHPQLLPLVRPGRSADDHRPGGRGTARSPPTWCARPRSATRSRLRGPIGGYFVWSGQHRPLFLVGGGSGLAPLRAMWRAADPTAPVVVARLG